jgi:signal peptidase I
MARAHNRMLPMVHDSKNLDSKKIIFFMAFIALPEITVEFSIKRTDIVVFNWPVDTVYKFLIPQKKSFKPIDKKSNYVKKMLYDNLSIVDEMCILTVKSFTTRKSKPQFSYTGLMEKHLLILNIFQRTRHYR